MLRLSAPEAIPHAPDGLNILRPVGVELDLIPDVLDVDGDGGHIANGLHPPHTVKEPVYGDNVFEKDGIRRDRTGDGEKTRCLCGKRGIFNRDGPAMGPQIIRQLE